MNPRPTVLETAALPTELHPLVLGTLPVAAGGVESVDVATEVPRRRHDPVWVVLPLVAFALVALTVGVVARNSEGVVDPTDYLRLFFSDPIHLKVWFASAALALAVLQVVSAAGIYGRLSFLPQGAGIATVHRWSGRLAVPAPWGRNDSRP